MGQIPYALYIAAIAVCVTGFAVSNAGLPWALAALGTLALPVPLSMRLRDTGISPLWALPLLIGLAYLAMRLLSSIASIGGAPGGGQPTFADKIEDYVVYAVLAMLALAVVYGAVARSSSFNGASDTDTTNGTAS